jgi:hypothetical protein
MFAMVAWAGVNVALFILGASVGIGVVELAVFMALWVAWFVALFTWAIPGDRRDRNRPPGQVA